MTAYGKILPRSVLSLPRLGCVNLHASILPGHRGASPISAAILAGDEKTGVCTMLMDEGLDTGDLLLVHEIDVSARETQRDPCTTAYWNPAPTWWSKH